MWMACATFDEIAEATDCSATVAKEVVSSETAGLPKATKAAADHATDFDPPIYNIWKQQEKTAAFGPLRQQRGRYHDPLRLRRAMKPLDEFLSAAASACDLSPIGERSVLAPCRIVASFAATSAR